MIKPDPDIRPMEDPHAALETQKINDFLRARGLDPVAARASTDPSTKKVVAEASVHASCSLEELHARSVLIHDIHGATFKS